MEPLDTDVDYPTYQARSVSPRTRFNWLLIFPTIGLLLIVIFILAVIFQFDLSAVVDTLIGLMILFFVLIVAGLFWALAPRANNP
jgi:membrane-bound ClpP family serine protease